MQRSLNVTSQALFLRKLLEDMLHQNKEVNKERRKYWVQERKDVLGYSALQWQSTCLACVKPWVPSRVGGQGN
jgi:hypothetical protein